MPLPAATFPDLKKFKPIEGRPTKIVVPISLWKATYFKDDYLKSIIDGLNNLAADPEVQKCGGIEVEFVLTGELQRHTQQLDGKTPEEALHAALQEQEIWENGSQIGNSKAHKDILKQLNPNIKQTTTYWEQHHSNKDYTECRAKVDSFHADDPEFLLNVGAAAIKFVKAFKDSGHLKFNSQEDEEVFDKKAFQLCREYILEELAVMFMWKKTKTYDYMFYPVSSSDLNKAVFDSLSRLNRSIDSKDESQEFLNLVNICFEKPSRDKTKRKSPPPSQVGNKEEAIENGGLQQAPPAAAPAPMAPIAPAMPVYPSFHMPFMMGNMGGMLFQQSPDPRELKEAYNAAVKELGNLLTETPPEKMLELLVMILQFKSSIVVANVFKPAASSYPSLSSSSPIVRGALPNLPPQAAGRASPILLNAPPPKNGLS